MIDYDGTHVIDGSGEAIGTVERTYADDNGRVQFVEVKIGTLLAKHRMVPAAEADLENDGLHVPYDKGVILSSPDVSDVKHVLDGDVLGSVRDYYADAPVAAGDDTDESSVEESEAQEEVASTPS